MTQALYAHMNNKRKKSGKIEVRLSLKDGQLEIHSEHWNMGYKSTAHSI
jgi:hypothetical protein